MPWFATHFSTSEVITPAEKSYGRLYLVSLLCICFSQCYVNVMVFWNLFITKKYDSLGVSFDNHIALSYGIMVIISIFAESFIKRIYVLFPSLCIALLGLILFDFLTFFGKDEGIAFNIVLVLMHSTIVVFPLVCATILTQVKSVEHIISVDSFVFLIHWLYVAVLSCFLIMVQVVNVKKEILMYIFGLGTLLLMFQLLLIAILFKKLKQPWLYFNIHYHIVKMLWKDLIKKFHRYTITEIKDDKDDKLSLCVNRLKILFWFLIPLVAFEVSAKTLATIWEHQSHYTYTTMNVFIYRFKRFEVVSDIFTLVTLPITFMVIFPFFEKCKLLRTDLQKIGLSFGLLLFCFTFTAAVQYYIENHSIEVPDNEYLQVRIINGLNTPTFIRFNSRNLTIPPHELFFTIKKLSEEKQSRVIEAHNEENHIHEKSAIVGAEARSTIYTISQQGVQKIGIVPVTVYRQNIASVYILSLIPDVEVTLRGKSNKAVSFNSSPKSSMESTNVEEGLYEVVVNKLKTKETFSVASSLLLEMMSISIIYVFEENNIPQMKIFSVWKGKVLNKVWLLPSVATFGLANGMKRQYNLKFTLSQTPPIVLATVMSMLGFLYNISRVFFVPEEKIARLPTIISFLFFHACFTILFIFLAVKYEYYSFLLQANQSTIEPLSATLSEKLNPLIEIDEIKKAKVQMEKEEKETNNKKATENKAKRRS